jgi:hypothetical protein
MNNEIVRFIEKQDSIFSAAKYFGGMEKLKELSKTNKELSSLIDYSTKGKLFFKSDDGKNYKFSFHVKDFHADDTEEEHLYVIIDLIIPGNNNYQEKIAIWVDSYCEDGRPEYHFNDSNLNKFMYTMGRVDSVNGVKIPDGSRLDDMSEIISDNQASRFLKENVTECLKRLQNVLK